MTLCCRLQVQQLSCVLVCTKSKCVLAMVGLIGCELFNCDCNHWHISDICQ